MKVRALPAVVAALAAAYVLFPTRAPSPRQPHHDFGALPASFEGRVKPLDSVGRNALLALSGRQTLRHEGQVIQASEWLLGLMSDPERWEAVPVIRIDHPDVRALVGTVPADKKLFSFRELLTRADEISRQAFMASKVEAGRRDLFQKRVMQLYQQLDLHYQLAGGYTLHPLPPLGEQSDWSTLRPAQGDPHGAMAGHPPIPGQSQAGADPATAAAASGFTEILKAQRAGDRARFDAAVAAHRTLLEREVPADMSRARAELVFNRVDPFGRSVTLYVTALVLTFLGFLVWQQRLGSAALALVVVALVAHTLGLCIRIYLMGRPPVTNLYSSAVFIGWGCVLISVALEGWYRNGMGTLCAAITGFLPLLVADGLAGDGDTMAMLQAVLDTNFWLASHVITIALGYSATFLAGALAMVLVLRGTLTRSLDAQMTRNLARMIYGTTCFAILFSFTGTVLGGIWADQSWGRFWGWDPKENGALILVLWNAITLHGWWGGVYRGRGLAAMAILGNVVVAWSWFGTNMLGVGLHSYGFMDGALFWLLTFVASQVAFVLLAAVPVRLWRSGAALAPASGGP